MERRNPRTDSLLLTVGLVLLATLRCGGAAGAPCRTTGSGFTLQSPCRSKCLDLWSVVCPNGERVSPEVCAGVENCSVGDCPEGQICYHFDDPIEVQAYCVPVSVCTDAQRAAGDGHAWEVQAEARARETRLRFRSGGRPAAPPENKEN
jgi:hypothetical protein